MAQRQPWENDPIVGGAQGGSNPLVTVGAPNRQPTPARPDQARGESNQADLTGYEAGTRPRRDAAADERAAEQLRLQQNQQRFTQQQQVLSSWSANPNVRQYQDARTSYMALRNLQRDPNGVNAVATIFAFMKALDPGSTVREGEYATAQNTGGVPTSISNAYNGALSGNGLTDEQRHQMISAAADQLEARARTYNELTYRAREQLRGIGVPINDVITQMPFSGARGSRGYELENRQRSAYGIREQLPDPEAIRRGEGATVNTPQEGFNRTGIPEGNLPEGQHVEFAMDELDPSHIIANATGTAPDAQHDLAYSDENLAAMEAWLRAHGRNVSPADFNAFVATLPPSASWQATYPGQPLRINNADAIVGQWNRGEQMFQGQTRVPPPDISDARGQGGAIEGADAFMRGAADVPTMGLADEMSAGMNTLFSGGTYADNLRRQRGVDRYDEENHPYLRTGGQLVGSLALPTGAGEAGRVAAQQAIRQGLGRAEAVAMARNAIAQRLGGESAAYAGAHGFGSGEGNILDRTAHAAVDSVLGYASGRLLPEIGAFDRSAGVPRTPRASAERPPLVDPTTGRVNAPLENATPAERVGAAADFGIDLPLGAATDRGGAIFEHGLDKLPGSAGVLNDSRRAVAGQVDAAVEDLGARFGNVRSMNEGGEAVQNSGRAWIRRAQGDPAVADDRGVVGRAYDAVPIPGETSSQIGNALSYLRQVNSRFASNEGIAAQQLDPQLQRYQDALERGGLSWQDLKDFRSDIGERIGRARFSDGASEGQLRGLYGALSEDMRGTAASISPRALRSFERANNLNREVETRVQDGLSRILGNRDGAMTPEQAAARVRAIISEGKQGGNLRLASDIRASTIKDGGWDQIVGTFVRHMGQPANSQGRAFDPGTFVQNYADMSEPARNLFFGSLRNGRGETNDIRKALDDFVEVNQRLAGANALRNTSQTVPNLVGASVAGSAAMSWINPLTALKLGAGAVGANALARLWTHPPFVRWATGYTKMLAGAARANGSPSAENIARQRDYLLRIARSAPGIAAEIGGVADRLFPQSPSQ